MGRRASLRLRGLGSARPRRRSSREGLHGPAWSRADPARIAPLRTRSGAALRVEPSLALDTPGPSPGAGFRARRVFLTRRRRAPRLVAAVSPGAPPTPSATVRAPPPRWTPCPAPSASPKSCPSPPASARSPPPIDAHPVVIVAGETGSGKTTQLPKICLAMGRGLEAHIGVTQPRRIAATSVAARVARELEVVLGREVGYQIRNAARTSAATYVKFMTDGITPGRDPRRSAPAPLRHHHPRRGARAEPPTSTSSSAT